MRSPSSRPSRNIPLIILGVLVGVGIAFGVVNNRLHAQGRNSPFFAPVGSAVYPFQSLNSRVQNWFSANVGSLFRGRELEQENARLRAENDALRKDNEKYRVAEDEAARLRELLHYPTHPNEKTPLVAPVVAWLPSRSYDTITIGGGTRNGVRQKSIVRTPSGLVGQVIEANPVSSQVLLLTDLQSGVGALVKRNGVTKSGGIVQGTGRDGLLEMVDLKHEDDVVKGDAVVSSGYGGVIPPGIPIGIVSDVSEDATHYLKTARITPHAPPPADLREVLVLAPQSEDSGAAPIPLPKTTPTPLRPSSSPSPKPSSAPVIPKPTPSGTARR